MDTGSEDILSQNVYNYPGHLVLFRKHVSRKATNKGRAVLEAVGLDYPRIDACFQSNPLNEEEPVQEGLKDWIGGAGFQPPTWKVLLEAMNYAGLAQQHIQSLKADLGVTEGHVQPQSTLPTQPVAASVRQVLDHFRNRFITEVDASSIVFELGDKSIISMGDFESITRSSDPMQQNQILHLALLSKCTINALKVVCDVIISVRGNPRMKALGRDMKTMLEGPSRSSPAIWFGPESAVGAVVISSGPSPSHPTVEFRPESAVDAVDVSSDQDLLKFEEQYSRVVSTSASVTLKITKCTTIGPPRIGKTRLKNLLTGQEWDVEGGTASTDVMEAPEWVECYSVEEGTDELWELVSKEQQLGEVVRTVNSPHATVPSGTSNTVKPADDTTTKAADDTTAKPADDTTAKSIDGSTTEPSAVPNARSLKHALNAIAGACSREAVKRFLKDKAGKVLGETRLIHFIDTGGQAIYHDVHPVLITSPSVYLVVFSLEDFYRKSDEERLEYFRSDLIQRPLRSIYTFGRKPPQQKGHLQLHPEAPRIFIVGTHLDRILQKDKVEGSDTACKPFLLAVDKMIEKEISTKPYHQFVQYDPQRRSFWAVDNTQAGRKQDEDVKKYISTFRRLVQNKSMEMSVRVPLPWMLLKVVMEGKRVHYLSYSQLLNEACIRGYVSEHSPEADLDNMLKLFHILGLMYHKVPREYSDKKKDSLVFINPDCLYSSTSDFLMAAKEEIDNSRRGITVEEGPNQTSRKEHILVDSTRVVQRIGNVVRDFLFDMHKVLCDLEWILMNVGEEPPEVVSQNLAEIQKRVGGISSTIQAATTLHAKYKVLAKEMVFRLTKSIRQVLKGSESENKKLQLDSIMKDFWFQCRTTRRSIEVADFDHLLQLLSDLRIIAQVNWPNCYVIPVVLPQSCDDGWQKDEIEEGGIVHEPILFTLISEDGLMCYLPSGLFCCLISELVTELRWTVIPLGRTHVAFTHKDFAGEVHLRECESYIMVNVKAKPKVPLQVENLHNVREQMYKTINRVHTVIYHTPDSESVVLGFQCTCADNAPPHFAAYQEDDFESCIMCLLLDSTECPLTEEQLVWFP